MPEQYLQKGSMRFEYGGKEYAEGYERTFGKKMCAGEHNLERVAATDEEKQTSGVCGAVICKRCDFRLVITTDQNLRACPICGLPMSMHTEDKTYITIEGLGTILCE